MLCIHYSCNCELMRWWLSLRSLSCFTCYVLLVIQSRFSAPTEKHTHTKSCSHIYILAESQKHLNTHHPIWTANEKKTNDCSENIISSIKIQDFQHRSCSMLHKKHFVLRSFHFFSSANKNAITKRQNEMKRIVF